MLGSSKEGHKPLVSIPQDEFEEMLSRAAEEGAKRALHDVGLDGENAAEDIRELRSKHSSRSLPPPFWWLYSPALPLNLKS